MTESTADTSYVNPETHEVSRPDIRVWARENGFEGVKATGRIRQDVKDAYAKAFPNT